MIHINNKVFIKLMVPEIDRKYDIYLPINKKVGDIINLLNKAINEITDGELEISKECSLYNRKTCEKYISDVLLLNTNIRNGTCLVLTL